MASDGSESNFQPLSLSQSKLTRVLPNKDGSTTQTPRYQQQQTTLRCISGMFP